MFDPRITPSKAERGDVWHRGHSCPLSILESPRHPCPLSLHRTSDGPGGRGSGGNSHAQPGRGAAALAGFSGVHGSWSRAPMHLGRGKLSSNHYSSSRRGSCSFLGLQRGNSFVAPALAHGCPRSHSPLAASVIVCPWEINACKCIGRSGEGPRKPAQG